MQLAKYEALVGRLEAKAAKSYLRFRLGVVAFAALGYVLMLLILIGILFFAVLLAVLSGYRGRNSRSWFWISFLARPV